MIEQNCTSDESNAKIIRIDRRTIIDAIKGKMKETNGRRHVLALQNVDLDGSNDKTASWDVLERSEMHDATYGEDYLEVEDLAYYDCNDDAYSDSWEARIDIHNEVTVHGQHYNIVLEDGTDSDMTKCGLLGNRSDS